MRRTIMPSPAGPLAVGLLDVVGLAEQPDVAPVERRAADATVRVATHVYATLPSGETIVAPIHGTKITVGQQADNDLVLDDPTVSHRHATLRLYDGYWNLYDAGSRNGTFVNGHRLGRAGCILGEGDVVTLGRSTFRLGLD